MTEGTTSSDCLRQPPSPEGKASVGRGVLSLSLCASAQTAPPEGGQGTMIERELAETERIRARHEAELAALIAAGATRTQIDAARRFIEALRRREEVMKCWIEYLDAHGSRSSGSGTG